MYLFLVLISFSILFYLMEKVLINWVDIFYKRDKFETTAIVRKREYLDKSDTSVYYVLFIDENGEEKEGKSLQYEGRPKFKEGDKLDIDYLIRSEMPDLIDTYLVDVKHRDHQSMHESIEPKLGKLKYISLFFFVLSIASLIYYILK